MIITKTIEIDAGHRVPNHKSKCKNFHGHRYKIEVAVSGEVITKARDSNEGMVMDFGDLRSTLYDVIEKQYDHSFIMYDKDDYADKFREWQEDDYQNIIFVPFIPTAENLAKHWYMLLKEALKHKKIEIKQVIVWETPTSAAIYEE